MPDNNAHRQTSDLVRRAAKPLFLVILFSMSSTCSALPNELSCNSDTVKGMLVKGTVGRTLQIIKEMANSAGQSSKINPFAEAATHFKYEIVNVRQTQKDESAVYCAADFEYRDLPSAEVTQTIGILLQAQGTPDATCEKTVIYKVQPLLDKPGEVHVTWRCLNN